MCLAAATAADAVDLDENEYESDDDIVDTPRGNPFEAIGVDRLLLGGLLAMKITSPAPIQEVAVPAILEGANCAVQSYTGSGKTLAYLLPALTLAFQRAEALYHRAAAARERGEGWTVQVLVVAPSQELAMQIVRVAQGLLPQEAHRAVQQCIGGASMWRQLQALKENKPIVVVGTPGRLAELMRAGGLQLHRCPLLVLDEADQLLGAVFNEDMAHITEHTGKRLPARQTVGVSATLSETVLGKLSRWLPSARFVNVGGAVPSLGPRLAREPGGRRAPEWGWGATGWDGPASSVAPRTEGAAGGAEGEALVPTMPPSLQHLYVVSEARHKVDALRRCLNALGSTRALVFMNFQQRLKDTAFKLSARGMRVGVLHGEMPKRARQQVLADFSAGATQVLAVSDVAARGLDLPAVDAVFNLELPSNAAHYAHRAGRTGRMGAAGVVVTLVAPGERFVMYKLAHRLHAPLLEAHLHHGQVELGAAPPGQAPKRRKPADPAADSAAGEPGSSRSAASAADGAGGGASAEGASTSSSAAAADEAPAGRVRAGMRRRVRAGRRGAAAAGGAAKGGGGGREEEGEEVVDMEDRIPVEGDLDEGEAKEQVRRMVAKELEDIRREAAAAARTAGRQPRQRRAGGGGGGSQAQRDAAAAMARWAEEDRPKKAGKKPARAAS